MQKLKIAYFGTPDFSATFLEKLLTDKEINVDVKFVVTQPDQKVGRKQIFTPSPVKLTAEKYNVPVFYDIVGVGFSDPTNKGEETSPLHGIDLALLYAYGEIIGEELLKAPKYGFWNIHPSLLPRYRGASPTAYPLIMGETITGVSLMQMDAELDHGPLIAQEEYPLSPTIERGEVEDALTGIGFNLFKNVILTNEVRPESIRQLADWTSQDDAKATYTRKLTKNDGYLLFETLRKLVRGEELIPAELPHLIGEYCTRNRLLYPTTSPLLIFNFYRGVAPWPGIWTTILIKNEEKRLKITKMSLDEKNRILPQKVQLEGKNEVDFETFQKAHNVF